MAGAHAATLPYPKQAHYKGGGDINSAVNFICRDRVRSMIKIATTTMIDICWRRPALVLLSVTLYTHGLLKLWA
jgi:hypothetical protein